MTELLNAASAGANLIPTVLLVLVVLYWITVIAGLLDLSFLDLDGGDADTDISLDKEVSVDWLNAVLGFFNLGHIPFMVWLSFLALPLWVLSLIVNTALGFQGVLPGLLTLVPVLLVSLFVAKLLTQPFVRLFAALNKESAVEESALGKMCTITIPADNGRVGQASVRIDGAPLILNVKSRPGTVLNKGTQAVVLDYLEGDKCYLIEPLDTEI